MTCIPKHIACGWWDPEDPNEGNFIAGPTDCTLQLVAETRSRLNNGGMRLRSVDFSAHTNNITAACIVYNTYDGSPLHPVLKEPHFPASITTNDLGTSGNITTELVELAITDWNNDTTYYYARQKTQSGSPSCLLRGTNQMQATLDLDSNRVIDLPEEDKGNFNTTCRLSAFSTDNFTGGTPAAPIPSEYRTGPIYTALFIDTTEKDDGTTRNYNNNTYTNPRFGTYYWNGFCWKKLDMTGSPLDCVSGSPIDCSGGPQSDC